MIHELKTYPKYFNDLASGKKQFEVRKGDRPFRVNDFLALNEYDADEYTGRCMMFKVRYLMDDPAYCKNGYVIMGLSECAVISAEDNPYRTRDSIPVYGEVRAKA
jgi:hypothetical protein